MSRRADSKKPAPAPEARSRGPSPRSGGDAFVLTLFFMSGASGLIYEVLFSRVLHLQMGSTVYAITTVLTAFMGGLALGAFFAGKRASEIAHPVRAYAYCELLIGGFALAVPLLLWMLTPIFRLLYGAIYSTFLAWSMVTFVLCALVLLPPTILMGATLPILTEGLTRRGALVGRSAGKLYAVNTLGAFAGALLAGFVLIPNLGQIATLVVGVLINLSLFGLITRRYPAPVAGQPIAAAPPRSDEPSGFTDVAPAARTIVAAAYAANGFAAMLYQVGWTRATALSLGSSTYTFSIIVSAFIFGLAIGAMALARFVDRLRHPLQTFAILEIGVGVSATLVLPIFGKLPIYAYDVIFKYQGSFGKLVLMELLMLFGLVAVPTLLMGALFPLSTSILRGSGSGSRAVGVTYAVNTIGTILGAFTMGFFLIPYLGVEKSLLLASACNVAFGCLALAWPWPPTLVRGTAIAVLLVLLYPAHQMLPPWDKLLMTSGPYLLDPQFQKIMKQIEGAPGRRRRTRSSTSRTIRT
ncbi:MAG: fused MFS/spermidine synthase [Acidobacteriota bacterium]